MIEKSTPFEFFVEGSFIKDVKDALLKPYPLEGEVTPKGLRLFLGDLSSGEYGPDLLRFFYSVSLFPFIKDEVYQNFKDSILKPLRLTKIISAYTRRTIINGIKYRWIAEKEDITCEALLKNFDRLYLSYRPDDTDFIKSEGFSVVGKTMGCLSEDSYCTSLIDCWEACRDPVNGGCTLDEGTTEFTGEQTPPAEMEANFLARFAGSELPHMGRSIKSTVFRSPSGEELPIKFLFPIRDNRAGKALVKRARMLLWCIIRYIEVSHQQCTPLERSHVRVLLRVLHSFSPREPDVCTSFRPLKSQVYLRRTWNSLSAIVRKSR